MCPTPDPPTAPGDERPLCDPPSRMGLVFLIGCNAERPAELPWPALAALAAADVVLFDGDVDPETLALIPDCCFVEPIPAAVGSGDPPAAERVRKLAGEGWRVVRLALDDPASWPVKLTEADRLAACGIAICTIASLPDRHSAPRHCDLEAVWAGREVSSIGLNGLAG